MIRKFDGDKAFLSNFYLSTIAFEGDVYPTVEHAFQAAKTSDVGERASVRDAGAPGQAKRRGRKVTLRADWEEVKNDIMLGILRIKFRDPGLRALLLATGDAELVEGNWWHDRYWGQCDCARCKGQGRNILGNLLMQVRSELRMAEQPEETEGEKGMELKETIIGSERIFEGRIVHLRVDTVRLPDGKESKREIVEHRGAVCIVPVREDGMVLLVRQFRLAAGKALLEIPAGTLEVGEEPLDCAARELEEETGYRAAELRPLFSMYLAPGYSTELIHAFLATDLTPTQAHTDADEHVELVPVPLSEIEKRVLAGEFQDAKTVASLLAASRLLNAN
jgi:ribA/ribD-fused uncharacterized protein